MIVKTKLFRIRFFSYDNVEDRVNEWLKDKKPENIISVQRTKGFGIFVVYKTECSD